jgi:hypothetical protein
MDLSTGIKARRGKGFLDKVDIVDPPASGPLTDFPE